MQRLVSLGMLAALIGGGWTVIRGALPADLRQAAGAVGAVISQGAQQVGANWGQSSPYAAGYPPASQAYAPPGTQQPIYSSPTAPAGYAPVAPGAPTPTIRIASFNVQVFGDAKARKPHVMRSIAAIVRQFDVVAIQEVRTQDDYFIANFLRDYVNVSNGVNNDGRTLYDARVSPRLGRTTSTEQYAFLFNTATVQVHPQVNFVLRDDQDLLHREPQVAMFLCRAAPPQQAFTFLLMNVHTDPDETDRELDALYGAYQAVQRMPIGGLTEDDVILVGDLNTNVPITPQGTGRGLVPADLRLLSRVPGVYAAIRDRPTNTRLSRLHDNLVYSRVATTEATGRAGVYDLRGVYAGLTEEMLLEVSDHLPVWAEFSAYESGVLGAASGPLVR